MSDHINSDMQGKMAEEALRTQDQQQFNRIDQTERLHDELTGQLNLTGLLDALGSKTLGAQKGIEYFVYINILNFKTYNQNYGFERGDIFLRYVADELASVFSDGLVCRVNSDHFIIYTRATNLAEVKQQLRRAHADITAFERRINVGINVGIYENAGGETNVARMIDSAHLACDYVTGSLVENIAVYDETIAQQVIFQRYIVTNFQDALDAGRILPYYQREIRGLTRRVCGYEALARWTDPTYGIISPSVFVPLLEDACLIHKLDLYIIGKVCLMLHEMRQHGSFPQPVSINLSRLDFELCDIFAEVEAICRRYDLPHSLLNIEITESAVAEGASELMTGLRNFKKAGYQIWMDDFGSGYSSFNNLRRYEFDLIKLDIGFLADLETNPRARVIVSSIVSMAKELGIRTLAEGVETKMQYDFLRSIGCGQIQGYYFGEPLECILDEHGDATFLNDKNAFDVQYEQQGQHEYYEIIGNINVMGTSPLQPREMRVYNNIAFAIIEFAGRIANHLYTNETYAKLLKSVGIESVAAANERINLAGMVENETMRRCAAQCEQSKGIEKVEVVINGNVCSMELRFIARHGDQVAFAVVMQNLSEYTSRQQAGDILAALQYLLTLYFRVDLYDEDGTVENIYLETAQQGRITDEETNAIRAVHMYSERYLEPDERERFKRFYDMSTVLERVAASGEDHVTDLYHSAIPEDHRRLQMYTILPFMFEGRWKGLSACRYVDTISDISDAGEKQGS